MLQPEIKFILVSKRLGNELRINSTHGSQLCGLTCV